MRVIAKSRLRQYWETRKYRDAEQSLRSWHVEMAKGTWRSYNGLKIDFPSASLVGNDRVVFNIMQNRYRLIVKFEFRMNAVYVRFFGTHAEYDHINAAEA